MKRRLAAIIVGDVVGYSIRFRAARAASVQEHFRSDPSSSAARRTGDLGFSHCSDRTLAASSEAPALDRGRSPNGSDAGEGRYLADGVTDDLIYELGRFRRLFVSSHMASAVLQNESHSSGNR
jgi:hypothetical protein